MGKADELREMLRVDYWIESETELDAAIRKMAGLNIGLFVSDSGRSRYEKKKDVEAPERKDMELYRDQEGRYFVAHYREWESGVNHISPCSKEDARRLYEEHWDGDDADSIFG